MKLKYDLIADTYEGRDGYKEYWSMQVSDDGKWVKAEEAEALEQLNKEMLEVLKEVNAFIFGSEIPKTTTLHEYSEMARKLTTIIAKAEEV